MQISTTKIGQRREIGWKYAPEVGEPWEKVWCWFGKSLAAAAVLWKVENDDAGFLIIIRRSQCGEHTKCEIDKNEVPL
jgi:hypothetical protein